MCVDRGVVLVKLGPVLGALAGGLVLAQRRPARQAFRTENLANRTQSHSARTIVTARTEQRTIGVRDRMGGRCPIGFGATPL